MRNLFSGLLWKRLLAAIVFALALSLAGCATETKIKYQPPATYHPPAQPAIIEKPQPLLFNGMVVAMKRISANIVLQDEKTGRLHVKFKSPNAEKVIDCGVVSYDDQTIPAAKAEQSFKYTPEDAAGKQFQDFTDRKAVGSTTAWAIIGALASSSKISFYQTVELEGVSFIELLPEGDEKTRAKVSAAYTVKRTLQGTDKDGNSGSPRSEQIKFNTGATGVFKDSTRCICNYELERNLLWMVSAVAAE